MCSEYIFTRWLGLVFFVGLLFHLLYVEEIELGLVSVCLFAFLVLLCALTLFNLWVLYRIQRQLKRKAFPLLEAIYAKKSDAVAWIYQLNTTYTKKYYSFRVQTRTRTKKYLVVVLSDGKKIHIKAKSEQHVVELMRFLSEVFPLVVMGYGPFQKADVEARIGKRIRNYFWFEY